MPAGPISDHLYLEDDCSICLEPKREPVAALLCAHSFCRDCLRGAYLSIRPRPDNLNCSICRKPSNIFAEISNTKNRCGVFDSISTLALKHHPPSKDKTFLHPKVKLDSELYHWLERQVNEVYDELEREEIESRRVNANEIKHNDPPTDDTGAPSTDDTRQKTTRESVDCDSGQPQVQENHVPIAGPSRIEDPTTTRVVREILSHSGRGRNISYQVVWTDGSVTSECKANVESTRAFHSYFRRLRNQNQRAYASKRKQ